MASPEEYARNAEVAALNSAASAKRSTDAAMECSAAVNRMERDLSELKLQIINRVDGLNARVKRLEEMNGGEAPKEAQPRVHLHSITEEDWDDSPSGLHKNMKVTKRRWMQWQKEQETTLAANRWHKMWKWARWVVVAVAGGALYMLGEQLMKIFFHHV